MSVHNIEQILGVKVNIYEFFSIILKYYKNSKEYTSQIIQQYPRGVDNIIKSYISHHQINIIYGDFESHIFQHFEEQFKMKRDQNTMNFIINFLEKRSQMFDTDNVDINSEQMINFVMKFLEKNYQKIYEEKIDMGSDKIVEFVFEIIDKMTGFVFEIIDKIIVQKYQVDILINYPKISPIIYREIPSYIDSGYMVIGCLVNTFKINKLWHVKASKIKGMLIEDCTLNIEDLFKIKNQLIDKLKNLGFQQNIELYTLPDFANFDTSNI